MNQRHLVSNHLVLYYSPGDLRTVEPFLRVEEAERYDHDFHLIDLDYHQSHALYLSPEAFRLVCNKEKALAKSVSHSESALVFMLGMNLLECGLLADLSGVYNSMEKGVCFDKLERALA